MSSVTGLSVRVGPVVGLTTPKTPNGFRHLFGRPEVWTSLGVFFFCKGRNHLFFTMGSSIVGTDTSPFLVQDSILFFHKHTFRAPEPSRSLYFVLSSLLLSFRVDRRHPESPLRTRRRLRLSPSLPRVFLSVPLLSRRQNYPRTPNTHVTDVPPGRRTGLGFTGGRGT